MSAQTTAPDGHVEGRSDEVGAASGITVPGDGPVPLEDSLPAALGALARAHGRVLEAVFDAGQAVGRQTGEVAGWRSGYALGVKDGRAAERADAEAELSAFLDVTNRALAGQLARTPSYDVLAERRGQPERAAKHRALMASRGIS